MTRTLGLLVLALLLPASLAEADEPAPEPGEDARAAIRDRGIVLKAGKRNYVIVVPPAEPAKDAPKGAVLHRARVYFGDSKVLFEQTTGAWSGATTNGEYVSFGDPRELFAMDVSRAGETFELNCELTAAPDDRHVKRKFALTRADGTVAAALSRASLRSVRPDYSGFFLGRTGTSYVYVDVQGPAENNGFRLFVGKRGAMKRMTIKDIANDSASVVLVTAKGTLTITKGKAATATWGTKKPDTLTVLPVFANRKLIYSELGIYTSERLGHPCYEL